MKLILASNSPRRRDLLSSANIRFEVALSDYEEKVFSSDLKLIAETFAFNKAKSVLDKLKEDNVAVLGADTVVFLEGRILGKPTTRKEAKEMLKSLSGKTHSVVTGYAILTKDKIINSSEETLVTFNVLSDNLIEDYLDSGLYIGKAGSYGIQDNYPLVKSYSGSLSNVIGLPIETITPLIEKILKQ